MSTSVQISKSRGFTLVEAIVVIVITGIIGGMVAVFIRSPVQGYVDAQRRAELTDVADTAIRRIARDVRAALPNSVRMSGGGSDKCIEFIPTKVGARYRAAQDTSGNGDSLDFTVVDKKFDMLFPNTDLPSVAQIEPGDIVVVYNDGSAANGNAYNGHNAVQVDQIDSPTSDETPISFVDPGSSPFDLKQLPSESPYGRFQVIPKGSHVVSYWCDGTRLMRYSRVLSSGWANADGDPPATCADMVAGMSATVKSAVLATNVSTCSLKYDAPGASTGMSRFGIVSISLGIRDSGGESVHLYDQVHVDNTP